MSRVINLTSIEQMHTLTKSSGYVVIIFVHNEDSPSKLLLSMCAGYSGMYPYIRFASIDIDICKAAPCQFPISFIPTSIFYRNGKTCRIIVGTDINAFEAMLRTMRIDGAGLAPAVPARRLQYRPTRYKK